MRGKVACADQTIQPDGITPAWAGKSRARKAAEAVRRDHPRVGGEKLLKVFSARFTSGSPPRGRGKGGPLHTACLARRITPAWAGKRPEPWAARRRCKDHPRVGGEKQAVRQQALFHLGSPPHGRGKVGAALRKERLSRITPAWAGKSKRPNRWALRPKDYPRRCREKCISA